MERINEKIQLSKQKLKSLPFRKIAPNIVTLLALCAGVTSIRYSIQAEWAKAVICVFVAAFFDLLDGRVGVAPAIMIYQWTMFDLPRFGWFFCLLLTVGMALRLARFNTMLEEEPMPIYWQHFFVGVSAPAAAALVMMPIMLSFNFPEYEYILRSNAFCAVLLVIVTFLMVSKIPTFSTKKLKVPTYLMMPLMLIVALFASFMITQPWMTLGIMTLLYALSIPLGVWVFLKEKKKA